MTKLVNEEFSERLDRLERENRLWRRGATVVLTGLIGLLLCGAHHANDDKDTRLDTGEVRILDREGRMRITLGSSEILPGSIVIHDELGAPKIGMSLSPTGKQTVVLDDRKHQCSMGLTLFEDGSFGMHYHGTGKPGFTLASAVGQSFLRFHDKENKTRAKLGLDVDGAPSLEFYDKDEKAVFKIPEH